MSNDRTPPILRPSNWYQYRDLKAAANDQDKFLHRLLRADVIDESDPLFDCGPSVCGEGYEIPSFRKRSPTAFDCPAACRIAQYRLERCEVRQIAAVLAGGHSPMSFVTVIASQYEAPLEDMETLKIDALVQAVKRKLKRVSQSADDRVLAAGRVDFDLAKDKGNLIVRPHVHLIICGNTAEPLRRGLVLGSPSQRTQYGTPVMVKPVYDIGALRYAVKGRLGGLPSLNFGSRMPTSASAQLKFDLFRMNVRLSEHLILFGMRRNRTKIEILASPPSGDTASLEALEAKPLPNGVRYRS